MQSALADFENEQLNTVVLVISLVLPMQQMGWKYF